jgi:hypothetical protein
MQWVVYTGGQGPSAKTSFPCVAGRDAYLANINAQVWPSLTCWQGKAGDCQPACPTGFMVVVSQAGGSHHVLAGRDESWNSSRPASGQLRLALLPNNSGWTRSPAAVAGAGKSDAATATGECVYVWHGMRTAMQVFRTAGDAGSTHQMPVV